MEDIENPSYFQRLYGCRDKAELLGLIRGIYKDYRRGYFTREYFKYEISMFLHYNRDLFA